MIMQFLSLCRYFAVIFFFIISSTLTLASTFQKKEALEKLKSGSTRWKQTQYYTNESQAKLEQANAANSIQLSLFSRSIIARTNQLVFGFLDAGPLNTVGFGVTGIQAGYIA